MVLDPVGSLVPTPRSARFTGGPLRFAGVVVRHEPATEHAARALLGVLGPPGHTAASLGPPGGTAPLTVTITSDDVALPREGYGLEIEQVTGPAATIRAADAAGGFHGAQTLLALIRATPGSRVPQVQVRDWPQLPWRGTVEGFYGPPWSHQDRLEHLRFAGRHKLNHFVYAPKDDPFHRDRWREPYPAEELALLADLVRAAQAQHVRFVWAVSPGLSMRYSDPAEHARLRAKAAQLWEIGVRDFALLFDDIPTELVHPEDQLAFGDGPGAAGAAHGHTCARFTDHFLDPRGVSEPLLMVPTDYAGTATSPYREQLAATLPAGALVWWTGKDIVIDEITRQHVEEAAASYRRRLLLWDNFPVNDFDRTRLFLGPLTGRATAMEGTALEGISANPMIEAAPSQLALASVADYAWNPGEYDAGASAQRALGAVTGADADALAALVEACSSWPPEVVQSGQLLALAEVAQGIDAEAARAACHQLDAALAALAATPDAVTGQGSLIHQLRPWIDAGADMARAGRSAAALRLAQLDDDAQHTGALTEQVEASLRTAEGHYANVLRDVVPPFARTVLRLGPSAGGQDGPDDDERPWAMVVTAPRPEAGEEHFAQLLRRHGLRVRFSATGDPGEHDAAHPPGLVAVARSATPQAATAAAGVPVPLLAWAHLVDLGLAQTSGVFLVHDQLDVVAPQHPLAASRTGRVTLYRGPGKVTWGKPAPQATVVARTVEGDRPALFSYPAGARLADGCAAPAPRIGIFLGRPAVSPWLMAEDGLALVEAAVACLTGRFTTTPGDPSLLRVAP